MYCSRDAEANDMIHMGKRPQKCKSTNRHYCTKEGSLIKKRTSPRRKLKQQNAQRAKMTKKRDPMKQSSSKSVVPNSKEKSSMKPKLQPPHRRPKMTESLTLSKQAEGVVDAGVTELPHWNEDTKAAATVKMRSGRLVSKAEAAHHSNECANAAATTRKGDLLRKPQPH